MNVELDRNALVVVAGAGGFIGGHMVARLVADGHTRIRAVDLQPLDNWHQLFPEVENVRADLRLKEDCRDAVQGASYVFDLASDMGGMGFIESHRADCMLSVLIGTHLLLAARDAGTVQRLFFASSACVYNVDLQRDPDVTALREDDAYPAMAEAGYGWEKLFMERMCADFDHDYGLTTRVARYHNVYGSHGTWDGGREKAPSAICRKVVQAIASGSDTIEIWGDGEQTRSFTYVDDCIEGTLRIMQCDYGSPLNLGSSELVTVNRLVDIVEEIAGVTLRRTYRLDAPLGVRGRNSDNTLIRTVIGWEPSTPLKVGLERTYRWVHDEVVSGGSDPTAAVTL